MSRRPGECAKFCDLKLCPGECVVQRFDNGLPTNCIMSYFANLGRRWRAAKVLNNKKTDRNFTDPQEALSIVKNINFFERWPITSRFWIRIGYNAITFKFQRILPRIFSLLNTIWGLSPVSLSHITSISLASSSTFAQSTADETFGRRQNPANCKVLTWWRPM